MSTVNEQISNNENIEETVIDSQNESEDFSYDKEKIPEWADNLTADNFKEFLRQELSLLIGDGYEYKKYLLVYGEIDTENYILLRLQRLLVI